MQYLYNLLIIPLLYIGFRFGGLFNAKIRTGIKGRKKLFERLINDLQDVRKNRVWFHISSYGEFEQAKPVLQKLKQESPDLFIVVSFFSPSAYENIKLTPPVDYICYLPFDSVFNANRFISIINPRFAVIVRHDIWPNFVWTLNKKNIPLILIDASIPENSSRFWPFIKSFNKKLYNSFSGIYTISKEESDRIQALISNKDKLVVTGDTKFDQVYKRALETEKIQHLIQHPFLKNKPIWVIGSSWPADEAHVIPAFSELVSRFKDLILLIIPHEPTDHRIQEIKYQLAANQISFLKYSQLSEHSTGFNAIIVDKMGLLADLYHLGRVALVGGSFEYKVHNVLEPAAHGIPVLFGPKITTQAEALLLVEKKAGFIVNSVEDIVEKITQFLESNSVAAQAGNNAKQIVMEHTGATEKAVKLLMEYLD